jgi:hypothetical protein
MRAGKFIVFLFLAMMAAQADQRRVPGIDSLPAAQADAVNRDSKTEAAKTQPTQPTQPEK